MMMNARQRPFPFTASQWQELEHQALIFKYMVAGIPIPSDLLYPFRRGMDALSLMSTPTPPRHFPSQPIGWGCFQMGCGRKPDPEPGRCRRTDGKKWRCSKEAFPDSKYCEKHMHRGRNRSRKPVEMTTATTAANTSGDPSFANPPPNSAKPTTTPSLSSPLAAAENHHHSFFNPNPLSFRPPGIGFSTQNNSSHFTLGTGSISSSADRDYRYLHGLKEGVDEHPFFSEASGSLRNLTSSPFDSSWRSNTSSLAQLKHGNCSSFSSSYSQLQMDNDHTDMAKQQLKKHCFSLDHVNMKRADEPQQPLRQFFDEWPLKNRDSWLDLEEDTSNPTSFPATQLSISIPMASSEFPSSNPRPGNGD